MACIVIEPTVTQIVFHKDSYDAIYVIYVIYVYRARVSYVIR